MKKYEEFTNDLGHTSIIETKDDGTILVIPLNEANSDYARYLRWLENPEAEQYTPNLS